MTYSLLARCPRSGRFGHASASHSIAAGKLSDGLRANIGASITQGFARLGNNALALNLLTQGITSQSVLAALVENDAGGECGHVGHLLERSAAVVVCGHFDYYNWDLRRVAEKSREP